VRKLLPGSLRGRLALAALAVTAVWVVLLTAAFNFVLANRLAAQADDTLRTRTGAVAGLVALDPAGRVTIRTPADGRTVDRGIWIYAGTRAVRRPTADEEVQHEADRLAGSTGGFGSPEEDSETRMYAMPVTIDGHRVATVVAAIDLDAYTDAARLTLLGSAALAALLLVLVYATTRMIVGRALRPVEQMTRQAAEWSTQDLDHRFGQDNRPAELDRLATILDELLARQAAVVRHDRQLTAELSHELRTPLTVLAAEVDLVRSRPRSPSELDAAHASIAAAVARMSGLLETLLAEARSRARTVPGRSVLAEVLHTLANVDPGSVRVDPAPDPALTAGVDPDVLERILAPLLDNARRHARMTVTLTAAATPDGVRITVGDDGPGVPPDLAERIFEPGFTAPPDHGSEQTHHGSGLGLPLARRLARGVGGDVTLQAGTVFAVDLPPG
jgi:signal transduction histidine kinase